MSEARTLRLVLDTPAAEEALEGVRALRLEGPDGHRGVLPGHERAVSAVLPGVLHVRRGRDGRDGGEELFVAIEGGVASIEAHEVRVMTGWASVSPSLAELARVIERRARQRARSDARARERLARHETALRRALARLEREVAR